MMKMSAKNALAAVLVMGVVSTASAEIAGLTGYGTLGISSDSAYGTGLGIKLGADVGKDMWGVENLALTGFIGFTKGKEDYSFGCDRKVTNASFAAGATYSYQLNDTWSFQGRAFPVLNREKVTVDCGGGSSASGTNTNITGGVGASARYHLSERLALRGDVDVLGGYWRFISVGAQYQF
jgi:hypothetical protein